MSLQSKYDILLGFTDWLTGKVLNTEVDNKKS